MGLGVLCRVSFSALLNTINSYQIRRPAFTYPSDRKVLHQIPQFSEWLHRKPCGIMPSWILWIVPHNQRYLRCSQRAQLMLLAVPMKALLHGMGLLLAPTHQGFRGCLALQPGSRWCWGLWKRQHGLAGQVVFLEMCTFCLWEWVILGYFFFFS